FAERSLDDAYDLLAAAAFGVEKVASRQLTQLGFEPQIIGSGKILYRGTMSDVAKANLWLRTADRVLIRLGAFHADDFGLLFDGVRALPWETFIPPDGAFPVNGRSLKSQLSSVPACQKIVKKAIVERLLAEHGVRELPETGPRATVEVSLLGDEATLTIDTTGPSLHKRGYRKLVGMAPLKETLAAAMIDLSYWKPGRPLIDPFCGSGTIPIEAAMVARNIAPGLYREFDFESWPITPPELVADLRTDARKAKRKKLERPLLGFDSDAETLRLARQHANVAGVAHDVRFEQRDFRALQSDDEYGCVIANPPYGERIGDRRELIELYQSFPHVLRRLPTWSHYVLTAEPQFEQLLGQRADRRRKIYNGRIECQLYQFYGPRPPRDIDENDAPSQAENDATKASQPRVARTEPEIRPAFGGLTTKADEQADLFRNRLVKLQRHLRRWPKRGIRCYRLYERDIPEIPLVVDRYHDFLHIGEYERPHDRTPAQHAEWLDRMFEVAADALEIPRENVYGKTRVVQRGDMQHQRQDDRRMTIRAEEGGLQFEVNLSDYVDTGLFLDHRIARGMVRDEARGKRFLNLFCYTGAFSVYAADGGAASTTSIDLSPTYVAWADRNLSQNGFRGSEHRLLQGDVMEWLRAPLDETYDLAVIDVPTFSNSKRTDTVWDVQQDHVEALELLISRMSPQGVIYFSTNFRRFKFEESAFEGVAIREISKKTVPEDFRNKRIHRCWRMVVGRDA
ncbi:MAG: bifunctional 23S rRNA (guanine(2069)-N(7))-methyltransferase RlmK/23S rRNA (guanine(2445)-N(2))-methyltransferase RlmL, partial [Blastopirellula sp. JB062]